MYVRAVHGFHHYANVRRGEVIDVTLDVAAQLMANGLVVELRQQPVVMPPAAAATSVDQQEAPKSGVGPFGSIPSGGQTGVEKPPSSSRRGRPRKTTTSKSAVAVRG